MRATQLRATEIRRPVTERVIVRHACGQERTYYTAGRGDLLPAVTDPCGDPLCRCAADVRDPNRELIPATLRLIRHHGPECLAGAVALFVLLLAVALLLAGGGR